MEQTLLLVEDDDTIAQLVQQQLREAGFAVHREADGLLAMAAIKARRYDLVLLNRVWGSGFDGYEHTVNSHINRLRSKIQSDISQPRLIETVWGVGYRLGVR